MIRAENVVTCNGCGQSAGNGGVVDCLVLADVDFGTGEPVALHMCRVPGRYDGNQPDLSCAEAVLARVPQGTDYPHRPSP